MTTNWAGNLTYRAARIAEPTDEAELSAILDRARSDGTTVRVLGSRHSFNDIADTDGVIISLAALATAGQVSVAPDRKTVRIPAGIRYGDLVPVLEREGLALANLASLPHISVAGAVQTGTHGSGDSVGALGTQVAAVELLTAAGERITLTRGEDGFDGAVVGLGALGIVTHLRLDVEPHFAVAQTVFEGVRWDDALSRLDDLTGAGDSVSLFTRWTNPDVIDQVWVKARTASSADDLSGFGARAADGPRHPIPGIDPTPCTAQEGVPGPWYDRLPHFRLAFTPSAGEELQSEYLVARADAVAAIQAVRGLADRISPLLLTCEVRTMAADDLWLSPAYGRPTLGIHFTWQRDEAAVRALLPALEAALPASARPHWGKVFTMPGDEVRRRYPRFDDFAALRTRLDPDRRFVGDYLARLGL
ncbi:FAD-binding protein [Microbacterium sp. ET2]|uniref:FAD-binding protein n=1 Tax=Microbacterium albipurpureum TaxID=3050384 RepID=UPI00259D0A4D|nr:FAD-binding protein [Microbacterium sp. ET2 (Ac-2212)]WJL96572.1 FAD-binding protein [Microbacterium sp. ET2 (Ac-2212)]